MENNNLRESQVIQPLLLGLQEMSAAAKKKAKKKAKEKAKKEAGSDAPAPAAAAAAPKKVNAKVRAMQELQELRRREEEAARIAEEERKRQVTSTLTTTTIRCPSHVKVGKRKGLQQQPRSTTSLSMSSCRSTKSKLSKSQIGLCTSVCGQQHMSQNLRPCSSCRNGDIYRRRRQSRQRRRRQRRRRRRTRCGGRRALSTAPS